MTFDPRSGSHHCLCFPVDLGCFKRSCWQLCPPPLLSGQPAVASRLLTSCCVQLGTSWAGSGHWRPRRRLVPAQRAVPRASAERTSGEGNRKTLSVSFPVSLGVTQSLGCWETGQSLWQWRHLKHRSQVPGFTWRARLPKLLGLSLTTRCHDSLYVL